MDSTSTPTRIRITDLAGPDAATVSGLVEEYLAQTELEKTHHLSTAAGNPDALERYRREIENPAHAYTEAIVHLAEVNGSPAGVIIVHHTADAQDIKRLWVSPAFRGRRVGSALLDAAMRDQRITLRLTVWDWRDDAILLYKKRGFVPVESWEDRPRLVCMERPAILTPMPH